MTQWNLSNLCLTDPQPPGPAPVPANANVPVARQQYREPLARHDLGCMDISCGHCGALHWMDEKLADSPRSAPVFGTCCNSGQVRLPALRDPPIVIRNLLTEDDAHAKEFRDHIRQYNAALAFTSLGVKIDDSINRGGGRTPYIFRINGELCHMMGAFTPRENEMPAYAQLYLHDPQMAINQRMRRNNNLRRDTMLQLQDTLRTHHHYAELYRHAHEILAGRNNTDDVAVRLRVTEDHDRRRYNLPVADEVAVIIPGDGTQSWDSRDIVLRRRDDGGSRQRIKDGHPSYACLHYVVLFPYGEDGWHWNLRKHQPDRQSPRKLSQSRYYAFRLHPHPQEFSTILRGGRLFQQYAVDAWAQVDQNRVSFLRHNQDKLRASLYSGLEDAFTAGDVNIDANELGQCFVLLSSYYGGPRHMHQCLQDSLALARFYRKIDLFVTVTCNPSWPEIMRELLIGQTSADRPDLVARVFQLKKKAIIKDIYQNGILGRVVAYVYTIEFQKRGLPHMHLLIFFEQGHKLLTPEDIDSTISAQWPDLDTEPQLFETVKKCMVHGPCGTQNLSSRCMENGKCTKHFPKAFQARTIMDRNGYPQYYRPDDGHSYEVGGHMVNNQFIIPYNPYLSSKFHCHINVKCVVSFATVKYVFKYVHKGGDRVSLEINQQDEIKRFVDGRYFSASEAVWRLLQFELHKQHPNVVRLQVHLPGQHMVTFDPTEDLEIILERAAAEKTTLTAFFHANASDGEVGTVARRMTYQEFPQCFAYKERTKTWAVRQKGFAIGRMNYVPPNGGEKFYLRTLLTVAKGPTSFEDLRTFEDTIHPTFRDACLARGLLEDDGEWCQCLQEAVAMQTGARLRNLFATLLLFCNPTKPEILWHDFRPHICDDLQHRLISMGRRDPSDDETYDYGLFLLDKVLQQSGRQLEDFPPMPLPEHDWNVHIDNHYINEQLDYNRDDERERAEQRVPLLNAEQRHAYYQILDSIENERGRMFFLNGPGGTGKTFVYNTLCHKVRSEGWIVLCVASSGIAALLLRGGRTVHSMFKIPVEGLTNESFCSIPKEGLLAGLFRVSRGVIWDEITMQHHFAPEALDRTLRDICNNDKPFGGITMVFGGDYQQILPVVVKGSHKDIITASIQCSYLWPDVSLLRLQQNMRLEHDDDARDFASWLLDVGHGRNSHPDSTISLHDHMRCDNASSLVDFIYPAIGGGNESPPPAYFLDRMILAARNANVNAINRDVLERMTAEEKVYYSADSIVVEHGADPDDIEDNPFPMEFLRTLTASGLPPGELRLKIGCPMILLRNLAPVRGLCNGTRMVLLRMSNRVLEARLIGGDHDGEVAFIPRVSLTPAGNTTDFAFQLKRRQFPVRPAFAITINKSQGQSAKYVGLDLRIPVFAHGQLYVALSRATSGRRIKVLLPDNVTENQTPNVVYPEVLVDWYVSISFLLYKFTYDSIAECLPLYSLRSHHTFPCLYVDLHSCMTARLELNFIEVKFAIHKTPHQGQPSVPQW